MKNLALNRQWVIIFLAFIFFILAACNMPEVVGSTRHPDNAVQTAQALKTSVAQTAEGVNVPLPTPPIQTPTSQSETLFLTTETPSLPTLTLPPSIEHKIVPGEPGKVTVEIKDANTATSGMAKHAIEGDIYQQNLFERPFNGDMSYRPDLDIQKAELSNDDTFFYVTIYLADVNPTSKILQAVYGVELDTDVDGRGDYLICVMPPFENQWTTINAVAFGDSNNDVGRKRALVMDVPSDGDGYDVIIFTAQSSQDPDLVWGRKSPDKLSAVQIAFKKSMLDHPTSFLFGVWADDGLKDARLFDYNDNFSEVDAGSPLEKNPNYPLKKLFAVDNTCRMGMGRAILATDPGVCGGQKPPIPTIRVPTVQGPFPSFPGSGN